MKGGRGIQNNLRPEVWCVAGYDNHVAEHKQTAAGAVAGWSYRSSSTRTWHAAQGLGMQWQAMSVQSEPSQENDIEYASRGGLHQRNDNEHASCDGPQQENESDLASCHGRGAEEWLIPRNDAPPDGRLAAERTSLLMS
eukprot:1146218-Pelagomonas_calceolata.AAC.6